MTHRLIIMEALSQLGLICRVRTFVDSVWVFIDQEDFH